MGCWNKTCSLTNLHINNNEPVYMFLLQQTNLYGEIGVDRFWSPVLLPFQGNYDDYGKADNLSGVSIPYLLAALRKTVIAKEAGPNMYHDIAVPNDDTLTMDVVLETVQEHRLEVADNWGDNSAVEIAMMKASAVDAILDQYYLESYVGDGNGNSGKNKQYQRSYSSDFLRDVPEFCEQYMQDLNSEEDGLLAEFKLRSGQFNFDKIPGNQTAKLIRSYQHNYSFMHPTETLVEISRNNPSDLAEYVSGLVIGLVINSALNFSRRPWMPSAVDSQNTDPRAHKIIANYVLSELKREKKEYEY